MEQDVTSLKDHVQILRRRWRVIAVCVLLGVAVALGLSYQQETLYTAEARMLVQPDPAGSEIADLTNEEVASQAQVVASQPVANRVLDQLGLEETPVELLDTVTVEAVEQTRTLAVGAERPDAEEAADVANALVNQYIEYRGEQTAGVVADAEAQLENELQNLNAQLLEVQSRIDDASDTEAERLRVQETALLTNIASLRVELTLAQAGQDEAPPAGTMLQPASAPETPSQPRLLRSALLGGILGLIVGVLLAYVRDRFDDGIRDEARLKSAVGDIPILGRMPEEPEKTVRPISLTSPHSASSEAYRSLTTNIRFLTAAHAASGTGRGELLVVSSAVSGEGKTTVATNIAVTAARVGLRVLLVDADLRYPNVHERLGIETPIGLTHLLADQGTLEDAVTRVDVGVGQMAIVGAGAVPPNPAELLASPRARMVWDRLRSLADLVVVDTAPVLGVADTLEVSREADLMLLVARYRDSRLHQMQSTIERIRQVGGSVDGVVWAAIPGKVAVYGYTSGRAAEKVTAGRS